MALLEPFIVTVFVCTMPAWVLKDSGQIVVGDEIDDAQAVVLSANALKTSVSWFPYVLSFAVIPFAFTSMISWPYYGY